jgi:3-oxoadipate enol-lactonase
VVAQRFSVPGPVGVIGGIEHTRGRHETPVVFVHHINGAAEQWLPVMEQLTDRDSVAVDLRGHGLSDAGGTYGAADYAADVAAAMDGLGISRAHLVGASFGGSASLVLAASQPRRIQSITLIGGALRVDGVDVDAVLEELRQLGPTPFFEKFAALSFAPATSDALLAESVRRAVRNDGTTMEQILRAAFSADTSCAAAHLEAPALVLTGEYDQTCPPAVGAELATVLGAECRVLAGRGHLAHIEDPALIAGLIDERLQHISSAPSR